jgi:hypothetical protein
MFILLAAHAERPLLVNGLAGRFIPSPGENSGIA